MFFSLQLITLQHIDSNGQINYIQAIPNNIRSYKTTTENINFTMNTDDHFPEIYTDCN